jgi:hypothetical protein
MAAALGERPVQVIEGNAETQPSPMDPPSGQDRDMAIRTMYGEDPGKSALGVANVIRRRAIDGTGGSTPSEVVTAKGQFEPWARPEARARMASLSPDSPTYQRMAETLDQAYAGNDPTGGATHFYAPKAQAELGRQPPKWAQGPSTTIGPHQFHGGPDQAALPPEAQLTQGQFPQAQPQQAQPPQQPPQQAAREAAMQEHRRLKSMAERLPAGSKAQDYLIGKMEEVAAPWKSKPPEFGVVGKDQFNNEQRGWIDPRTGRVTPLAGADGGGPKFDDVAKIRKEVQQLPSYKNIAEAAPIYKNMVKTAGENSKASDLNLVYSLGKIFDPGSVVREGEMVMVKNTASLPDWLVGSINALNGGARLQPETRAAILKEAHHRMQSYKSMFDQDMQMYKGITSGYGMREEHTIPQFGPFDQWQQPGAQQPQPQQSAPPSPPVPAAGEIRKGYRFKGGDPSKQSNWEKAN